ncbi:MAG: DUF2147 domain-containing protein [Salaquimonas sp.]
MNFLKVAAASAFLLASSTYAFADPVEGTWARPDGTLEIISKCGSAYCVTVGSGEYKGNKAGSFTKQADGTYKGKITQQATGITFSGTATVKGGTLSLSALMGLKKENWTRK